jgi:hypothetical protein
MSVQLTLFDLDLYTVQLESEPHSVQDPVAQEIENNKVQQLELPLFPQLMLFNLTYYLAA